MKRKMSSATFLIFSIILCAGCKNSDFDHGEEIPEVSTMQIVYEESYHLPQVPVEQEMITYTGESIDRSKSVV